jgi:hypothetical protein
MNAATYSLAVFFDITLNRKNSSSKFLCSWLQPSSVRGESPTVDRRYDNALVDRAYCTIYNVYAALLGAGLAQAV